MSWFRIRNGGDNTVLSGSTERLRSGMLAGWEELRQSLQNGFTQEGFVSLVLARPRKSHRDQPRKQTIRPVTIKGAPRFQWEQQFEKQQTHVNRTAEESLELIEKLFGEVYQEAYFFSGTADVVARVTPQGIVLQTKSPTQLPQLTPTHDRKKEYLIPEGVPCPFLIELDVMTADGKVKQPRQKKFRQINRYLEMVNDIASDLPAAGTLRIVDFGCGLSYLTFALHHLFHVLLGRDVELIGIDQNPHVIERCQAIASKLQLPGMTFRSERIHTAADLGRPDLIVSLHACDTATDHALAFAVGAEAKVILAAPCCQHELSQAMTASSLDGLLRHGVIKERIAALATDSLRAAALEAAGYRTQILEFIELEHTPKNLLLRAVRRHEAATTGAVTAAQRYAEMKSLLGVSQLATDGILVASKQSAPALLDGVGEERETAGT